MSAVETIIGFGVAGSGALASVLLRPKRLMVPVQGKGAVALPELRADAVIEEEHRDELTMTDHPVEVGTVVTDHAFMMPSILTLTYGWAAGSRQGFALPSSTPDPDFLRGIYERLLQFRAERILLDVYTGKRFYKNMLIRQLSITTNKETEHALVVRAEMREIIFARTKEVSVGDASVQKDASVTGATQGLGQNQAISGDRWRPPTLVEGP